MKKNLKTLFAAMVLASFSAVAVNAKNIIINSNDTNLQTTTINNVEMVPVRAVAEQLGYDVEWNGENKGVVLTKLPHYVTFYIGTDGYTFARTAPMSLGQAPVLVNDVAYVPASLFDEILNYEVSEDNDVLEINDVVVSDNAIEIEDTVTSDSAVDAEDDDVVLTGIVSVVSIDEDGITVNDENRGEVVLTINDDTTITDEDGNEVNPEDITTEDTLEVIYGNIMTMSIPAYNNPISIKVLK